MLTADGEFEQLVRATFGANTQIDLNLVKGRLSAESGKLNAADAAVVIVDIDATQPEEFLSLQRFAAQLGGNPPVIAITQSLDASVARKLVQMRVSDFLVKPVEPIELVRACARAAQSSHSGGSDAMEAQIYTFLPAAGGVGVTTLAIQTALLSARRQGRTRFGLPRRSRFPARRLSPIISTSSRVLTSTKSSRVRSVSTASFSK